MFKVTHQYTSESGVIHLNLVGKYPNTDREIDKLYKSIKSWVDQYESQRVLVDYFQVDYSPSPQQMIKNTQRVIDNELTEVHFAILFDTSSESYARYKLFLAKAEANRMIKNHNPKYKVFTEKEDALRWLLTK